MRRSSTGSLGCDNKADDALSQWSSPIGGPSGTSDEENANARSGRLKDCEMPRIITAAGDAVCKGFADFILGFTDYIQYLDAKWAVFEFFDWTEEHELRLEKIAESHVRAYIKHLIIEDFAAIGEQLDFIRSMFDRLVADGLLLANPAANVRYSDPGDQPDCPDHVPWIIFVAGEETISQYESFIAGIGDVDERREVDIAVTDFFMRADECGLRLEGIQAKFVVKYLRELTKTGITRNALPSYNAIKRVFSHFVDSGVLFFNPAEGVEIVVSTGCDVQ